jgi:hypothetical protein
MEAWCWVHVCVCVYVHALVSDEWVSESVSKKKMNE